jgi:anti-sigma factor RsiW
MSACELIQAELSAYLDGELNAAERAELDAHLRDCAPCRAALAELRHVQNSLHELPRAKAPSSLLANLQKEIAQPAAAKRNVVSISAGSAPNLAVAPSNPRRKSSWGPALLSLVAMVMLGVLVFAVLPRVAKNQQQDVAVQTAPANDATHVPAAKPPVAAAPLSDDARRADHKSKQEFLGKESDRPLNEPSWKTADAAKKSGDLKNDDREDVRLAEEPQRFGMPKSDNELGTLGNLDRLKLKGGSNTADPAAGMSNTPPGMPQRQGDDLDQDGSVDRMTTRVQERREALKSTKPEIAGALAEGKAQAEHELNQPHPFDEKDKGKKDDKSIALSATEKAKEMPSGKELSDTAREGGERLIGKLADRAGGVDDKDEAARRNSDSKPSAAVPQPADRYSARKAITDSGQAAGPGNNSASQGNTAIANAVTVRHAEPEVVTYRTSDPEMLMKIVQDIAHKSGGRVVLADSSRDGANLNRDKSPVMDGKEAAEAEKKIFAQAKLRGVVEPTEYKIEISPDQYTTLLAQLREVKPELHAERRLLKEKAAIDAPKRAGTLQTDAKRSSQKEEKERGESGAAAAKGGGVIADGKSGTAPASAAPAVPFAPAAEKATEKNMSRPAQTQAFIVVRIEPIPEDAGAVGKPENAGE